MKGLMSLFGSDRVITKLYTLLIFLLPLIMFHRTSELFEFNKMLLIYLVACLVLASWIARAIITGSIIIKKTPLYLFIFLLIISQILSTVSSIDVHTSIFGYYGRFNGGLLSTIAYAILFFVLVNTVGDEPQKSRLGLIKRFMSVSLFSSVLVILWGLPGRVGRDLTCLLFTGKFNNDCWTAQFVPAERMFSTLGQPNWLGAYLAVNFFFALYFYLGRRSPIRLPRMRLTLPAYTVFLAYLSLNFSAVLFTRSRSALFAIIVGILPFVVLFVKHVTGKDGKSTRQRSLAFLFLSIALSIFLFKTGIGQVDSILRGDFLKQWFQSTSKHIAQPQTPNLVHDVSRSSDIRLIVWQGALELGKRFPVLGTGVETFGYSYYFVRPAAHNLTSEWDFLYNRAHNEYLNYLATSGIVGLVTYLLLITAVLGFVVKPIQKQKGSESGFLLLCLVMSYLTILITNFFGFATTSINVFFYLIPSFIVLVALRDVPRYISYTIPQRARKPHLFIVPTLVVLFGVYFVLSYFLADIFFARGDNFTKIQDYQTARINLESALKIRDEHVYRDRLSHTLANLAFVKAYQVDAVDAGKQNDIGKVQDEIESLFELSEKHNLEALSSSPKNVLYYKTRAKNQYIFFQITQNDLFFQKALEALKEAEKLAPTDPKLYYTEAMFYVLRSEEEGKKFLSQYLGEALAAADHAIALKENYRDGYFARGLILKRAGRLDEARESFAFIVENLNPADREVLNELKSL